VPIIAVGGVRAETVGDYFQAGAVAAGIGSSVYAPGRSTAEIESAAKAFMGSALTGMKGQSQT